MKFLRRETYPNNLLPINHRLKTSPTLIFSLKIFAKTIESLNTATFAQAASFQIKKLTYEVYPSRNLSKQSIVY